MNESVRVPNRHSRPKHETRRRSGVLLKRPVPAGTRTAQGYHLTAAQEAEERDPWQVVPGVAGEAGPRETPQGYRGKRSQPPAGQQAPSTMASSRERQDSTFNPTVTLQGHQIRPSSQPIDLNYRYGPTQCTTLPGHMRRPFHAQPVLGYGLGQ